MGIFKYTILSAFFLLTALAVRAQFSLTIATTTPVSFDFNTIAKYKTGITIYNAATLYIESDRQWDLTVAASTTVAGQWDNVAYYSTQGTHPGIDILLMQFRNASNTSLESGFFPLTDKSAPTYIIGTAAAPDPTVSCPNNGTNEAGSYLINPNCYKFNVDMKIVPGFTLRPGIYELTIEYRLVEDL